MEFRRVRFRSTRQNLPTLRRDCAENLSAYGAYIMAPADSERQVTLIASGSEVQIALEAQKLLRDEGISSAVVSMPSWELFGQQPAHYRDEVPGERKRAVEGKGGAGRVVIGGRR